MNSGSSFCSSNWMSGSSSCATSVSQGVQSQLFVCSQCSEKVEHKCSCCNMKEIAHIALEDSGNSSAAEGVSVVAAENGLGYGESVNIQDCYRQTSVHCLSSEEDVTIISKDITMCQEFSQSLTLDGKAQKYLSKSKTFLLSKENSAGTSIQSQDSVASGNSAFAHSISLPLSLTHISAMKGGRAQSGAVKSELRVKWAPGVYDPPATTMSHTVKGHQQRPKAKKDKSKHKGKSSRGSGERKHGNRKCSNKIPEPLNARFQASGNKQAPNGFGKCKVVDVLEYDINGQDVKCSSSFLWETLPKVHLSMGEAS